MKQLGCSCVKCIECCNHSCGWFGSIKEIKGAAKLMNMSLPEFAKEYLIEEWWCGSSDGDISVVAPRKDFTRSRSFNLLLNMNPLFKEEKRKNGKGFVRASWGHNLLTGIPCIFLDENNKCKIHNSKPQECKEGFGCKEQEQDGLKRREKIAKYWKNHEDFIVNLKKEIENGKNKRRLNKK